MHKRHSHIGEAVRERREQLGLTQTELAVRLGWAPSRVTDVSDLEVGGRSNPTLQTLQKLANALGCHVSDLVFTLNTQEQAAV